MDSVTWKIGGEAGFGIMSSGTMLSKALSRKGYRTIATNEYPSLIRGGHNVITLRMSVEYTHALNKDVHILAALNKETVRVHKDQLSPEAIILFDPQDYEWKKEEFSQGVHLIPIPLKELVRTKSADPVMRNTILLGATFALLGKPFEWLEEVIRDQFTKKGETVINFNIDLAKTGYSHVQEAAKDCTHCYLDDIHDQKEQLVINASESLAIGAIRAGMKFAAIYPMTPINSVISFFADHAKDAGILYKQPEDEIAGINMAIGASFAGVRSMVASSGGGVALMTEGLSLAGNMEIPLVIDLGMRVGPATGMPTWTEQSELRFAIHAGHGEFPRIVLAPASCEESFELIMVAFEMADKYQTPVFILTDKYLNESQWSVSAEFYRKSSSLNRGKIRSVEDAAVPFRRYALDTADGVSARSFPGNKGGQFFSNSYEHDETGHVTEDPELRTKMSNKRMQKLQSMKQDIIAPRTVGDANADITLVTWGSTTGPVLEAARIGQKSGKKIQVIYFPWLFPFPVEQTKELFSHAKKIIAIEQNSTGQLVGLLKEYVGTDVHNVVLKYDGRPFFPEEIIHLIEQQ